MTKLDGISLGYSYHFPSEGWSFKLRNILSQFSDIFSEFDKYIAPAYHHDRCERSVQMRLYSMHKRELVMVFVTFFACLGLGTFIGIAGPPVTSTTELDGGLTLPKSNQSNNYLKYICSGPFSMKSPKMTTYHQQLWLIAKISTANTDDEIFYKTFHVSLKINGINEDHKLLSLLDNGQVNNRTRHLKCEKQDCDEFIVLHLGFLDYSHYEINVRFYGLEEFHRRYVISRLTFYFRTYNPAFTQIEIWFRFIFLLTTFFITCWFIYTLRRYPMYDWSIEQKWMSILLPLSLGFNNPVFPMSFLSNSWFPGIIDAVAQVTFLCALFLFWLCLYHGLRQNERSLLVFYFPKLIVVGVLWFPCIMISFWQKYHEFLDPTFNYEVDTPDYYVVKYIIVSFGVVYVLFLSYLIIKTYSELRFMPFFDLRLKFATTVLLIIVTIMTSTTISRYGISILEDSYVSQMSTHYSSSALFMLFYGTLNFSMYIMAYVYSPGTKSVYDYGITKDNPVFSMINDSDEDVVYGSEDESRKPLKRPRNDDDSD